MIGKNGTLFLPAPGKTPKGICVFRVCLGLRPFNYGSKPRDHAR